MVEDNEIKAQVSPFAIREGEIKTFDGKDGYVSMNQIVHKINIGHILLGYVYITHYLLRSIVFERYSHILCHVLNHLQLYLLIKNRECLRKCQPVNLLFKKHVTISVKCSCKTVGVITNNIP